MSRRRLAGPILSWASQVKQYPPLGEPGIGYFAGETGLGTVDCLLWRDDRGVLRGILNRYGHDFPPYEKAGNVNIFVQPEYHRQGIGTALVAEAERRWGPINLDQQQFTEAGERLADRIERSREG